MFARLFPARVDEGYRGRTAALWLFGLVLLVKGGIAVESILSGRHVATSADAIPLDRFPPEAAGAVVSMFALWGVAFLALVALGAAVLVRWRALVPLMFLLLLLEQLGRKLVLQVHPMPTSGSGPGTYVNWGLITLMVVGLLLSLWPRRR